MKQQLGAQSMVAAIQTNFRVRQSFGKIDRIIEIPNLIDIQMKSYDKFLQTSIEPGTRQDYGLQGVFRVAPLSRLGTEPP